MSADDDYDYLMKVVLVGPHSMAIMGRYTRDQYCLDSKTTIGIEFQTKTVLVDGARVRVQVWGSFFLLLLPFFCLHDVMLQCCLFCAMFSFSCCWSRAL